MGLLYHSTLNHTKDPHIQPRASTITRPARGPNPNLLVPMTHVSISLYISARNIQSSDRRCHCQDYLWLQKMNPPSEGPLFCPSPHQGLFLLLTHKAKVNVIPEIVRIFSDFDSVAAKSSLGFSYHWVQAACQVGWHQ